jgi:hypothetical protein
MRALRLAWPGIALTITFVDDLVAGPLLAAAAAWVGGIHGVALGVLVFTALVGGLVGTTVMASRTVDPQVQERIDRALDAASRRRFVGRFVRRVGDDHPWPTALVAAAVSPVLAVLLARIAHPSQRLTRTAVIAVTAYGLAFAVFYTGLGAGAGSLA